MTSTIKNIATTLTLGIVFLACVMPAQEAKAQRGQPDQWQWNVPDERADVTHGTLISPSMEREIGFNVFLPDGYSQDQSKRFPVVYFLHGASGSEASDTGIAGFVKQQIEAGKIGDVIYVFPNGGHYSSYRDWKDGNVKSETWIIDELIPHIDATYRTISAREGRAISGFSMGGDGSFRLAMKHPDKFCAVAALAPALNWQADKADGVTVEENATKNADFIRENVGILVICGEDDTLFSRQAPVLAHLDSLKIPYTFHSLPGVPHNLGMIRQQKGEEIVQTLAKHYAAAR